jgi:hypothetical protein
MDATMMGRIGLASCQLGSLLDAIELTVLCEFARIVEYFMFKLGRLYYISRGFDLLASFQKKYNYLLTRNKLTKQLAFLIFERYCTNSKPLSLCACLFIFTICSAFLLYHHTRPLHSQHLECVRNVCYLATWDCMPVPSNGIPSKAIVVCKIYNVQVRETLL